MCWKSEIMFEDFRYRISKIFRYVYSNNEYLLEPFNPIVDSLDSIEKLGTQKYHLQYLFYMIPPLYVMIDSIIVYFTIGYDTKNPYLFQHIILSFMPEYFRHHGDLIFGLAVPMNFFFISLCLENILI